MKKIVWWTGVAAYLSVAIIYSLLDLELLKILAIMAIPYFFSISILADFGEGLAKVIGDIRRTY